MRKVPSRVKDWILNTGETVTGCRGLGCYSATLGAFCSTHAEILEPKAVV